MTKISQQVKFESKIYNLEYLKNEETGEMINTDKNSEFLAFTESYDESVLAIFEEKMFFFKFREDYFATVVEGSSNQTKSVCSGSANYVSYFYKDVSYNNLMDVRWGFEFGSYYTYKMFWGGGLFHSDNATNLNEVVNGTYGFRVPNVGSQNNDELSSMKIVKLNASSTFSNHTLPKTDYTVVMFQDANFVGRALAIHANACSDVEIGYLDFTTYNMTAFKKWNDNVSSYSGYYKALNWLN